MAQGVGAIALDIVAGKNTLNSTLKSAMSEAKDTVSKTLSGIGSVASTVGKTVAVGMGVAGTAVAGLATKAVQSYADFEQLVGGVETLFGAGGQSLEEYAESVGKSVDDAKAEYDNLMKAQSKVFINSANAFKTAGLSQNEYMETVTGFSASLIASLGGDTVKASEVANQAIIDMSDNANKMGSSMESIQNAYSGFAKQNYTMLDNLKLGYGGTKEEMQRLLKDAEKLSGQKFDLSSYADVIEAIHVIQNEMGITGTTAKEASATISGSIGMMKASWQNLVTGIASANGDIYSYIEEFVDSVGTVADNLIPRISIALEGIVLVIQEIAPMLIAEIPKITAQILPQLIATASSLIEALVAIIPDLVNAIVEQAPAFIQGFIQIVTVLIQAMPTIVQALVDALPTLLPAIIDGTVALIVAIASVLPELISPIIGKLPEITSSISESLKEHLLPLVDSVITPIKKGFKGIYDWCKKNETPLTLLGIAVATITTAVIAYNSASIAKKALDIAETVQIYALITAETAHSIATGIATTATTAWSIATTALSTAMAFLTSPITLVILAIGALIAIVVLCVKNWDKIKEVALNVWEGIKSVWNTVADWFNTKVVQPVVSFFKSLWDGIKAVWDGICLVVEIAFKLIASIIDGAIQLILLPFTFIWENCKEYVFSAWEWIKNAVSTAINWISDIIATVFTAIKDFFIVVWDGIKTVFTTVWDAIVGFIMPILERLKESFVTVFNAVKNIIMTVWNAILEFIVPILEKIRDAFLTGFNAVKDVIMTVVSAIKNVIITVWNSIVDVVTTVVNKIKTVVSSVFNSVKTTVSNIFNAVKTSATNTWNGIKDAITKPIEKAKDKIKSIIDTIKGFFSKIKLSFPDIKLPHFSVKPKGWKVDDLLKGEIPKLGIEWYAKAMNNPMIMNKPTIFGYDAGTGNLLGGGEAGSELIVGTNTLLNMIRASVASVLSNFKMAVDVPALQNVRAGSSSSDSGLSDKMDRLIELFRQFIESGDSDMTVPIYIGNELIDEYILNKNNRNVLRSGGRA